jgi:hypothetical protein
MLLAHLTSHLYTLIPFKGVCRFTEFQGSPEQLALDLLYGQITAKIHRARIGKSTYSMLRIRIITRETMQVPFQSVYFHILITVVRDLLGMNATNLPSLLLMGCTCYSLGLHHMSIFYNNSILAIDSQFAEGSFIFALTLFSLFKFGNNV